MVKLPIRWQRAAEQNSDDFVQSRCLGKMKSVPVIASQGKKQRILSAKPFQVLVSAATSWPFLRWQHMGGWDLTLISVPGEAPRPSLPSSWEFVTIPGLCPPQSTWFWQVLWVTNRAWSRAMPHLSLLPPSPVSSFNLFHLMAHTN